MVPTLRSRVLGIMPVHAYLCPVGGAPMSYWKKPESENIILNYEKRMLTGKDCLLREQLNINPNFNF